MIVLKGLEAAPSPCLLRINPIDPSSSDVGPNGWPEIEIVAQSARSTNSGVEIIVGPEIKRYAAITEGTPVELVVPAADVRAEFLWPNLEVEAQPRKRNVVVARKRGEPAPDRPNSPGSATAAKQRAEILPLRGTRPNFDTPTDATAADALATFPKHNNERSRTMSQQNSILGALDALDALADRGTSNSTSAKPDAAPSAEKPENSALASASASSTPARGQVSGDPDLVVALLAELKRDIANLKKEQQQPPSDQEHQLYAVLAELKRDIGVLKREQALHSLPPHEQQLYSALAELRRDISILKHEQIAPAAPSGDQQIYGLLAELRRDISHLKEEERNTRHAPNERDLYAMLADLRREIHEVHELQQHPLKVDGSREAVSGSMVERTRHSSTTNSPSRPRQAASLRELAAYVPLVLIAVAALYMMARPQPPIPESAKTPTAIQSIPAPRAAEKDDSTPLFEALAVGTLSPRGVNAAGVDPLQALARAQAALSAPGSSRDVEEGGFWLRRYLASAQGDKRLPRALTQLGTLYVEQVGPKGPDYVNARHMWEIAGSLGDPVAMCFLGRLFENGITVPASRGIALQWYERARDAGGCAGLDEALTRLRP